MMEAGRTSANKPATPATAKRKASHASPMAQELRAGLGVLASSNAKKKPKQANVSCKVHFDSPFALKWSPVAEDVRNEVVERLSRELGGYKRIRVKKERKKRKAPPAGDQSASTTITPANANKQKRTKKTNKKTNKGDKTAATATGTTAATVSKGKDVMELEGEAENEKTEVLQVETKLLKKERSGKIPQAKDTEADAEARETTRQKLIAKRQEVREKCTFIAVGLNAVTKALEDKQLEVVVVCKDVEPPRLVQHIPVQAFLTGVPLVPLSGDLSLRLGAIFGIRTVMAIGFKRGTEHLHGDLVAFLKSQAVPLNIPWLLPCKTAASAASGEAGSAQADGTATTVTMPEPLPLHSFKARVAQPKPTSSSSSTPQKKQRPKNKN